MRVAREGVPFILLPLAVAALTSSFGWVWVGGAFFIAALKMAFFFRDPVRHTPQDDTYIFSPADGKVIEVEKIMEEETVPFPATRISIFLSTQPRVEARTTSTDRMIVVLVFTAQPSPARPALRSQPACSPG